MPTTRGEHGRCILRLGRASGRKCAELELANFGHPDVCVARLRATTFEIEGAHGRRIAAIAVSTLSMTLFGARKAPWLTTLTGASRVPWAVSDLLDSRPSNENTFRGPLHHLAMAGPLPPGAKATAPIPHGSEYLAVISPEPASMTKLPASCRVTSRLPSPEKASSKTAVETCARQRSMPVAPSKFRTAPWPTTATIAPFAVIASAAPATIAAGPSGDSWVLVWFGGALLAEEIHEAGVVILILRWGARRGLV